MSIAEKIVTAARSAIGTPFRHQGRIVGHGLDCAGLAVIAAQAAGIDVQDEQGYPRLPGGARLESAFDRQLGLARIPVTEIMNGDILLMTFEGQPQHVAIVCGENIVHAYERVGRVVEHGLTDFWRKRIIRAYRFAGVA